MAIHVDALIRAAITRGEFDNLPGHGKPLELDEDRDIPPEDRMTYRILKNSGFVPPEVQEMKAIQTLEGELEACGDPDERERLRREIRQRRVLLKTALERKHGR